ADRLSDEIDRVHTPHDLVLPAGFDQPGYGNGSVVRYHDHGDSADWSGHYLAAEAIRHEMTGDARALARAEGVARGISACQAVEGSGVLSRVVIAVSSLCVRDMQGNSDFFVGTVGG